MSRLSHAANSGGTGSLLRLLVCIPAREQPTELNKEVESLVQHGRMTAQPEAAMADLP